MTLTFEFPLPPSELSPNKERNGHWSKKSKSTERYRMECSILARPRLQGQYTDDMRHPFSMLVEYYCCREKDAIGSFGRYKPMDVFNVPRSIKALVDGMVDAGVFPDDSLQYISEATVRLFYVSERAGEKSMVRVTLTSAAS